MLSHTVANGRDTLDDDRFVGEQRPLPVGMIEEEGGRGTWRMIRKSGQPHFVAGTNLTLYPGAANHTTGARVMQGDPGNWKPANSSRAGEGGRGRVLAISREEGERSVWDGRHSLTAASPPHNGPVATRYRGCEPWGGRDCRV